MGSASVSAALEDYVFCASCYIYLYMFLTFLSITTVLYGTCQLHVTNIPTASPLEISFSSFTYFSLKF